MKVTCDADTKGIGEASYRVLSAVAILLFLDERDLAVAKVLVQVVRHG